MIYLASPYSHPDPVVREARFIAVCKAAAKLMLDGHVVFSPIAHSHSVELHGIGEVKDGEFWKAQDVPLLRHASMLMVLRIEGWQESVGIKWEMDLAERIGLPIGFIDL